MMPAMLPVSNRATESTAVPPNNDDYINSGRGKAYDSHPGNIKFDDTVRECAHQYQKGKDHKIENEMVVEHVQKSVRRFLEIDAANNWNEMEPNVVNRKIRQALRDRNNVNKSREGRKKKRAKVCSQEAASTTQNQSSGDLASLPSARRPSDEVCQDYVVDSKLSHLRTTIHQAHQLWLDKCEKDALKGLLVSASKSSFSYKLSAEENVSVCSTTSLEPGMGDNDDLIGLLSDDLAPFYTNIPHDMQTFCCSGLAAPYCASSAGSEHLHVPETSKTPVDGRSTSAATNPPRTDHQERFAFDKTTGLSEYSLFIEHLVLPTNEDYAVYSVELRALIMAKFDQEHVLLTLSEKQH